MDSKITAAIAAWVREQSEPPFSEKRVMEVAQRIEAALRAVARATYAADTIIGFDPAKGTVEEVSVEEAIPDEDIDDAVRAGVAALGGKEGGDDE
jgi:hypothetical protein